MIPVAGCDNCSFAEGCGAEMPGRECVYFDEIQALFYRTCDLFGIGKGELSLCQVGQWIYDVKKMLVEAQP